MRTSGMMKRFAVLATFVFALSALSDYIYWQVGSNNSFEFAFAQFVQVQGDTKNVLTIVDAQGIPHSNNVAAIGYNPLDDNPTLGTTTVAVWSQVGTISESDRFYFELFDDEGDQVACSLMMNGTSIQQFIHKGITSTTATPFSAGTVVPEPTSGMMLLLGGALLALRRRRV